jgi:hypothetical protein
LILNIISYVERGLIIFSNSKGQLNISDNTFHNISLYRNLEVAFIVFEFSDSNALIQNNTFSDIDSLGNAGI